MGNGHKSHQSEQTLRPRWRRLRPSCRKRRHVGFRRLRNFVGVIRAYCGRSRFRAPSGNCRGMSGGLSFLRVQSVGQGTAGRSRAPLHRHLFRRVTSLGKTGIVRHTSPPLTWHGFSSIQSERKGADVPAAGGSFLSESSRPFLRPLFRRHTDCAERQHVTQRDAQLHL